MGRTGGTFWGVWGMMTGGRPQSVPGNDLESDSQRVRGPWKGVWRQEHGCAVSEALGLCLGRDEVLGGRGSLKEESEQK